MPVSSEEEGKDTKVANKAVLLEPEDEIENISMSEARKSQARPSDVCVTISVIPIRHLNARNDYLEKSIADKIIAKKVKVRDILIHRSAQGAFTRCDVAIEPLSGKDLEQIDFEFENCYAVPFYGLRIM